MSDKELNKILNGLNKNLAKAKELMFIRPLSPTVEYAKFFYRKPSKRQFISDFNPNKCYLIKNKEGIYIGIVLDMYTDLHWYIKREFRAKGYLTKALKGIILTHLFNFKEEQQVTISKHEIGLKFFKISEKVALSVGFKFEKSENLKNFYILKKEEHIDPRIIEGKNTPIAEERMKILKHTFDFLAHSLKMIEVEIEMHTGDIDYSEDLKSLAQQLKKNAMLVEDKWYEYKQT